MYLCTHYYEVKTQTPNTRHQTKNRLANLYRFAADQVLILVCFTVIVNGFTS